MVRRRFGWLGAALTIALLPGIALAPLAHAQQAVADELTIDPIPEGMRLSPSAPSARSGFAFPNDVGVQGDPLWITAVLDVKASVPATPGGEDDWVDLVVKVNGQTFALITLDNDGATATWQSANWTDGLVAGSASGDELTFTFRNQLPRKAVAPGPAEFTAELQPFGGAAIGRADILPTSRLVGVPQSPADVGLSVAEMAEPGPGGTWRVAYELMPVTGRSSEFSVVFSPVRDGEGIELQTHPYPEGVSRPTSGHFDLPSRSDARPVQFVVAIDSVNGANNHQIPMEVTLKRARTSAGTWDPAWFLAVGIVLLTAAVWLVRRRQG